MISGKLASALIESLSLEDIKELERLKSGETQKPEPMTELEKYKHEFKEWQKKRMYPPTC